MYKAGDFIKVRSLQSLSNEYGLRKDGNTINSPYCGIKIRDDNTPFHNSSGLYECIIARYNDVLKGIVYSIRFKGEPFPVLDKEIVEIRGE